MNIHRALADLADIRAQLERTETYRGFRSTTVGVSALVVGGGAIVQAIGHVSTQRPVGSFLAIWISVALISGLLAGVEMIVRGKLTGDPTVWRMHRQLTVNLLPALLVGAVLTALVGAIAGQPSNLNWALPGIWSLVYGLGLFQCAPRMTRHVRIVAGYFLVTGIIVLWFGWLEQNADAWQMLVTFGVGQAMLACVLGMDTELQR